MGIDGMSMSQINQSKELPSNHLSFEAETTASMNLGDLVQEIDATAKKSSISHKEDNYGEDVENQLPGGSGTSSLDDEEENNEEETADDSGENCNKKRYCLKFSKNSDIIMLYDTETQKIVQTITEQQLEEIVANYGSASGVFFSDKA